MPTDLPGPDDKFMIKAQTPVELWPCQVSEGGLYRLTCDKLASHLVGLTYLPGPDDGTRHRRKVPHTTHAARLALRILHLELLVQRFDVVLDPLDQLSLILAYRTPDVRSHKKGIETREDPEHLIGVLGGAKLVAQAGGDPRLHAVNPLVISGCAIESA